jgi:hypothetical protein
MRQNFTFSFIPAFDCMLTNLSIQEPVRLPLICALFLFLTAAFDQSILLLSTMIGVVP